MSNLGKSVLKLVLALTIIVAILIGINESLRFAQNAIIAEVLKNNKVITEEYIIKDKISGHTFLIPKFYIFILPKSDKYKNQEAFQLEIARNEYYNYSIGDSIKLESSISDKGDLVPRKFYYKPEEK